jgi:hypothetical protein
MLEKRNDEGIDTLTREVAAARGRRQSLKVAGAAALFAVGLTTRLTDAKGKGRKGGKAEKKQCKKQVSQCNAAFEELCSGSMGAEECRQAVAECCQFLGKCNAGGAMACIVDLLTTKT